MLLLILVSCSSGGDGDASDRKGSGSHAQAERTASGAVRLLSFDRCDAAVAKLRAVSAGAAQPWGLPGFGSGGVVMTPERSDLAVRSATGTAADLMGSEAYGPAAAGGGDGRAFSGTNVQVQGVDEPDVVKTDGDWLLAVHDGVLRLVDVTDPARPRLVDARRLSGWDHRLVGEPGEVSPILLVSRGAGEVATPDEPGGTSTTTIGPSSTAATEPTEPTETTETTVSTTLTTVTTPDTRPDPTPTTTVLPEPVDVRGSATGSATEPGDEPVGGPGSEPDGFLASEPAVGSVGRAVEPVPAGTTVTPVWVSEGRLRFGVPVTSRGELVDARVSEGRAHVVVSSTPVLPFVTPMSPGLPGAEKVALEANRRVLSSTELEDWVPQVAVGGREVKPDCSTLYVPSVFEGAGTVQVLSLPVTENPGEPQVTTIAGAAGLVYASQDHLWVATSEWEAGEVRSLAEAVPPEPGDMRPLPERWPPQSEPRPMPPETIPDPVPIPEPTPLDKTTVHMLDISGDGPAVYLASGKVDGHPLDQFSLDEHEGRLRIATTTRSVGPSSSAVYVLERRGGELVTVGSVRGLGATEEIRAVRFLGDTAYVVTFRQTDPLFVVDLSDPVTPRVAGELKIPGYSAYLHPIGEGRLLGVGQDATEDGRILGVQVSLFDTSDPASPRRLDTWQLPQGNSPVEVDHRAFLWWAPESLAAVPVWSPAFSGVVGLDVKGSELSERGRVGEVTAASDAGGLRSVVVGDRLLVVSGGGVVSVALGDLASPVGLGFDR